MPYKKRYRKKRFNGGELRMGERKLTTYTQASIKYPSTVDAPTTGDPGATAGGIDGGTASPAAQFAYHFVGAQQGETDAKPPCVQFGSRSRVVYDATSGVPPAGSHGNGITNQGMVDGTFPIVLHPKSYDGSNNISYDAFTGSKYATTGVAGKVTFFNSSQGDFATSALWTGETIIKVYLLLQMDGNRPWKTENGTYDHVSGTVLFNGNNHGVSTQTEKDFFVNSFIDVDVNKTVRVLRSWTLELSSSGGDEAFLPFDFYVPFRS